MTIRSKIIIDKYIGTFLVVILNVFARILGFLLRRNHDLKINTRSICICKFVGMGSIIQATPMLQTLRLNYPESKIIFLTAKYNKELIDSIDCIDEALYIDESGILSMLNSALRIVTGLLKERSGCFIDLEIYSNFSTIISTLSCAKNRFGYFRKDSAIRMGIYTHMVSFTLRAPISKVYMQMAHLLGCTHFINDLYNFKLDKNISGAFSRQFLKSDKKFIVINPNASDLRIERRWPKENFVEIIRQIFKIVPDFLVVLIGSKNESRYVGEIKAAVNDERLIDSSGCLELKELFFILNSSSLMITNDTGPMHISFALKIKTIALFGPCSPDQYGHFPYAWCIYKGVYCSPCVHEFLVPPCGGDNQCMQLVETGEVVSLAKKILSEEYRHNSHTPEEIIYTHQQNALPLGLVRCNI